MLSITTQSHSWSVDVSMSRSDSPSSNKWCISQYTSLRISWVRPHISPRPSHVSRNGASFCNPRIRLFRGIFHLRSNQCQLDKGDPRLGLNINQFMFTSLECLFCLLYSISLLVFYREYLHELDTRKDRKEGDRRYVYGIYHPVFCDYPVCTFIVCKGVVTPREDWCLLPPVDHLGVDDSCAYQIDSGDWSCSLIFVLECVIESCICLVYPCISWDVWSVYEYKLVVLYSDLNNKFVS